MFGWFKKKQQPFSQLEARCHDILARAAALLEMQLMLCKADKDKYQDFLHTKFVRGYFVGFFDSALQQANIPVGDDEHFILLISAAHTYLFHGNTAQAMKYAVESLTLQNDEEFAKAQAQGGGEYFDFLHEKIRSPFGLSYKFHSIGSTNT